MCKCIEGQSFKHLEQFFKDFWFKKYKKKTLPNTTFLTVFRANFNPYASDLFTLNTSNSS